MGSWHKSEKARYYGAHLTDAIRKAYAKQRTLGNSLLYKGT